MRKYSVLTFLVTNRNKQIKDKAHLKSSREPRKRKPTEPASNYWQLSPKAMSFPIKTFEWFSIFIKFVWNERGKILEFWTEDTINIDMKLLKLDLIFVWQ